MIECHVYIVVWNVLYDGVYMYKSLQTPISTFKYIYFVYV